MLAGTAAAIGSGGTGTASRSSLAGLACERFPPRMPRRGQRTATPRSRGLPASLQRGQAVRLL